MNYLLIDTSNQPLSVAVMQDNQLLSELNSNLKKNHSAQLMPAIESVIKESGIGKKEINAIIVAQGPGSYTGLRIGVTVAKTLAYALDAKLYGVSSLAALAATVDEREDLIVPLFDARREAVYTGVYQNHSGQMKQIIEDQYLPITDLLTILHDQQQPYVFVGQDAKQLESLIDGEYISNLPRAKVMLNLIENEEDVHQFTPNYIKLSEAERNWINQQNKN
ncbi:MULTISPECIES: tRNA (adenosine(37)-N6)-threonylcarbamoyltransferase complex dimerization subunit type 1 TsaB [Staphylococcus]|uniref:tRNA (Adenosine(37)-N6)-threonylcarbamoyltransferase complex dimerization subunit type 1 TsaB n=1 Tax=Staphylococcus hsinchuensis TaxID=3051183 RepID=A0ABZ3ED89_9STAP|nr:MULTISPECIES: tRNA (adenosine(37)-N6)-threonylcarbamoyltransferase complex dimerization subunit type 1 TsaB [unclassified Staphylococcus]